MPHRRRRSLRAFARTEVGGAAVENALILSVTAVMIYSIKAAGVEALYRPAQQAFAVLIKALS